MKREKCPICQELFLVEPLGSSKSPLLVVSGEPKGMENRTGMIWSGDGGDVLKGEFRRAGLRFMQMRHVFLYRHSTTHMSPRDFDWHEKQLLQEMRTKRGVLIVGTEPSQFLLGEKVSEFSSVEVSDLLKKRFPVLTNVEVAVACYNPVTASYRDSSVGEVRLAIERFATLTREIRYD